MNRRAVAWGIALPSVLVLWLITAFMPLPFVTYQPGITENLLGTYDGKPVVQVSGHKTYRDDGELRLTTIYVTGPETRVTLGKLMKSWISDDDAIYPYQYQYPQQVSRAQDRTESQAMMTNSKEVAVVNALKALDYDVPVDLVKVTTVQQGTPAAGVLEAGDVIRTINGAAIATVESVATKIQAAGAGEPEEIGVTRNDKPLTLTVTPQKLEGKVRVGIQVGAGYRLPFQVTLNMDENIGGPSAGLMFSLAVYDTLTPGSMTGGAVIAGTGTAEPDGSVGAIGGIQQKIAASHDAGAELFFVPKDNCDEALASPHADQLRLVRADTMKSAVDSLEAWVKDHDASLPSCSAS